LASPLKNALLAVVMQAGHFEPVVEPDDERDEYHVDLEVE
jgi:hypothetical protein